MASADVHRIDDRGTQRQGRFHRRRLTDKLKLLRVGGDRGRPPTRNHLAVLRHCHVYPQVHGRAVLRFVPFNAAGAACVIAASQVTGAPVYALWAAPITLQCAASCPDYRSPDSEYPSRRPGYCPRRGLDGSRLTSI